jgi:23S rRNA (uracil1939-C5)-methyltransferase
VAVDGRRLTGDPTVSLTVGGIAHRLGPETFYQVNLEANALLVEAVGEAIRDLAPAGLLDAFSGAGNLSLPLAAAGLPVALLEREGAALRDARATAKRHGLAGVTFHPGDANALTPGAVFFDVALLDPPRAGAKRLMASLLVTRPRAIVYVSCNPRTLGRDVRAARAAGYRVERLLAYDFFPQTPHVETLCVLVR